ncbi:MAG: 23S rRNA (uracil(1939)-C(5))-methyltransferase RlmD [Pseudomonadales bacterium]|nr:23S rRNA (uracil(1939)-C(5))-methyltransferase RlmD [Pseudomonadales bacterium]
MKYFVKNRDPVEISIETLHPDGYGLSADESVGVFGALPGETVIAKPFTRKRGRTFARTESVVSSSAQRITPVCSAAAACGGCSLQHMDPEAQIRSKQSRLFELFGNNQPDEVMEPVTGPVTNYRAKARLGAKHVKKMGRVLVGFREKMSPLITLIDRCEVLQNPVGALVPELAALIEQLSVSDAIPQIEVAIGEDDVALVFRHMTGLTEDDKGILVEFARAHDVSIWLQPGDISSVHKLYPADGIERLSYSLPEFNLELCFHPLDFVQVNTAINTTLVNVALTQLRLEPEDRVLDSFCGIGNFTLPIATRSAFVYGIEGSPASVARGKENARRNGIDNCTFEEADLLAESLDLPVLKEVDKILLDPPRSGAEQLCKKLASSKVERVVYVSCNPRTLARDAEILVGGGYRFEKAGVIDMFPNTAHIESIAVFSRTH